MERWYCCVENFHVSRASRTSCSFLLRTHETTTATGTSICLVRKTTTLRVTLPSLNEYDYRILVPEVFLELFLRERVGEPRSGDNGLLSLLRRKSSRKASATRVAYDVNWLNFKASSTRIRFNFLFENGDFFSGLAYRPHVFGKKGHRKRIFFKNALQSGDFL